MRKQSNLGVGSVMPKSHKAYPPSTNAFDRFFFAMGAFFGVGRAGEMRTERQETEKRVDKAWDEIVKEDLAMQRRGLPSVITVEDALLMAPRALRRIPEVGQLKNTFEDPFSGLDISPSSSSRES